MSTFAEFDAIATSPVNPQRGVMSGTDTIAVSATAAGDEIKRSVRFAGPLAGTDPDTVLTAARSGVTYNRTAPIGDRGANHAAKRVLTGAAALSAVRGLTGFAPAPSVDAVNAMIDDANANTPPGETVIPRVNGRRSSAPARA